MTNYAGILLHTKPYTLSHTIAHSRCTSSLQIVQSTTCNKRNNAPLFFCISYTPIYAFKIESSFCAVLFFSVSLFSSFFILHIESDKLECNVHKTMLWQQVLTFSLADILLKFNTFHKWSETYRIQDSNRNCAFASNETNLFFFFSESVCVCIFFFFYISSTKCMQWGIPNTPFSTHWERECTFH